MRKTGLLFGFSGKRSSGKNTYATYLESMFDNVVYIAFGDYLKNDLTNIYNVMRDSKDKDDAVVRLGELYSVYGVIVDDVKVLVDRIYDVIIADSSIDGFVKNEYTMFALQYWGTNVMRKYNNNHWVDLAAKDILKNVNLGFVVFVTDMRFENEANAVYDLGGVLIRLNVSPEEQLRRTFKRDGVILSDSVIYHSSETSLDGYSKFDIVIDTESEDSFNILKSSVSSFVKDNGV